MKVRVWLLGAAVLFLMAACAPMGRQVALPAARLVGVELVAIDPFADRFALDLELELLNPNAFDLPLLASELKVKLGDLRTSAELPAMTLPAGEKARASLRVETTLARSAATAADLLAGKTLPLWIGGRLRVEALGQGIWLGPYTLLEDRVKLELALRPPRVTPLSAQVRLGFGALEFRVRYRAENPLPVGFLLEGDLVAELGGVRLGEAPIALRLPPAGEEAGAFVLRVPLSAVPGAARSLTGGVPFGLRGTVRLAVPGVLERTFALELAGTVH